MDRKKKLARSLFIVRNATLFIFSRIKGRFR